MRAVFAGVYATRPCILLALPGLLVPDLGTAHRKIDAATVPAGNHRPAMWANIELSHPDVAEVIASHLDDIAEQMRQRAAQARKGPTVPDPGVGPC
jgi:endonuclease/exonuclease/phosphatase family metal-dependent hydrolase